MMSEDCVKVAVRVRPLIPSEIKRGCQNCISVVPGEPQIQINGTEKSFTYNYVFRSDVDEEEVYNCSVKGMIEKIFEDIREDTNGIKVVGATERDVKSSDNILNCLALGSQKRATGATAINTQSSRSHAIFTITVHQSNKKDPNSDTTSKFHLVDLAGSERSKKSQATGERFRETININQGLLTLGNVISSLGENATYVCYRNSKLTRLLQDSLGGNSITLMIACVSPADYNSEETLSTLRYADRALKIKNKPIINHDPKAAEINRLNSLVKDFKLALLEKGPSAHCPPEHRELVEKNRSLQKMIRDSNEKLSANFIDSVGMHERAELAEQSREILSQSMVGLIQDIHEAIEEKDVEVIHSKLKNIHEKMVKLQDQQKQLEADMIHQILSEKIITKKRASDATAGEDSLTGLTLDEEHREHTLLQVERNEQVNKINRELAAKEELVAKLLMTSMHFPEQTKEIQDMENEIKSLQSEKEQLMKTLEDVQANNASARIAESRRRKMMELEEKISDLRKKCTEQSRILESKEKSDEQVKNLRQEIQAMKQMRVKLVRDMRKEADKFHHYMILMDSMEDHENLVAERDLALTGMRNMELAPNISLEEHRKILEEGLEKSRNHPDSPEPSSSMGSSKKKSGRTYTLYPDSEEEQLEIDETFGDDVQKDPDFRGTPKYKRVKSLLQLPQLPEVRKRKKSTEGKCQCNKKCQNNYCKCKKNCTICDNECGCDPTICENRNKDNQTCYFDDDQFAGQVKKMKT